MRETWWRYGALDPARKLIVTASVGMLLFVLWAALSPIDEVTRGEGRVIPSSKAQIIQSVDNATIEEILVRSGETVKAGQMLIRLRNAQAQSQLGQLDAENEMLKARAARLDSEAGGASETCGENSACVEEGRLQQVRRDASRSKEATLSAAVEQRRRDLGEANATVAALQSSVELARSQVQMLEPQVQRKIIPQTELIAAQREFVDTQGRLSAARQAAARASAAVAGAQAELASARLDFRQQALSERSEAIGKLAINEQSRRGASEIVNQNEVRAPVAGIVNDLKVNTVGGVVAPGEKLLQIVPSGDKLLVEARIKPKDIAFIKLGDRATVKVTAYDFSTYGGLPGRVAEISPDSLYDENSKEAYYIVQVRTDRAYIQSGTRRLSIIPGMVCDVEILTGRRSILRYLLKPVSKAFGEALTEH